MEGDIRSTALSQAFSSIPTCGFMLTVVIIDHHVKWCWKSAKKWNIPESLRVEGGDWVKVRNYSTL